jgi:hypothetical protein
MRPLLRVAIPTFNRLEKLKKQIDFFKTEIERENFLLNQIEFIVYDNASTDGTSKFLYKLNEKNKWLKYVVNNENIGLVGNVNKIFLESNAVFTWAVGDDDQLEQSILSKVILALSKHDETNWLFINHDAHNETTKLKTLLKATDIEEGIYSDGKEIITKIFLHSETTPMFITACIYKTESIVEIVAIKDSVSLVNPLEYSFYCASKGFVYIIDEILIHNKWGDSSWKAEERNVMYFGVFSVLFNLENFNYSKEQIIRLIRVNLKSNIVTHLKFVFKGNKLSLKLLGYFNNELFVLLLKVIFQRIKKFQFFKKSA